jgi:prevent-host-death family protein
MKSKSPSANVSKLKLHLGKYLAMVKSGKNVIVLDRTTPVARLVPYSDDIPDALVVTPAIEDAAALGSLQFPPVSNGPTDSVAVLLKERKERL